MSGMVLFTNSMGDISVKTMESLQFFTHLSYSLLILLGILCVILELFIPGGIVGAIGAILILFTVFFGTAGAVEFIIVLSIIAFVTGILLFSLYQLIPKENIRESVVLKSDLSNEEGFSAGRDMSSYAGEIGVTESILRPVGKIDIKGEILDATAQNTMIDSGVQVKVIDVKENKLIVKEISHE